MGMSEVRRRTRAGLAAAAVAGLLVGVAGCGSDSSDSNASAGSASGGSGDVTGTVTVFAAASLTESFTKLGKQFEAARPGARVKFNFAGSSALAQQITAGAPADVFAAASEKTMRQAVDGGAVAGAPTVFVKNQLSIAVPPANPAKITGLADLAKPGVKVALCAPQVPCGDAAAKVQQESGVTIKPVTEEQDVKAALTKVKLGEVDAALVYRTDVASAGASVTGIAFPESAKAVNTYPIAVLAKAPNSAGAKAFTEYVLSADGRAALSAAGFQAP
jgi:molybdate transport system substrate-binding protein